MESYELYETPKDCWANFSIVDDPRDMSDFLCWAIEKAFFKMFPKSDNWLWHDAQMINEEENEYKYLGVTHNGILVLRVYEKETYEQTKQFVVKML